MEADKQFKRALKLPEGKLYYSQWEDENEGPTLAINI
jgi:hypothetical protein